MFPVLYIELVLDLNGWCEISLFCLKHNCLGI